MLGSRNHLSQKIGISNNRFHATGYAGALTGALNVCAGHREWPLLGYADRPVLAATDPSNGWLRMTAVAELLPLTMPTLNDRFRSCAFRR